METSPALNKRILETMEERVLTESAAKTEMDQREAKLQRRRCGAVER